MGGVGGLAKVAESHSLEEARFVGCCGAYCRTCRSHVLGRCRGCKLGYEDGSRDMSRARCRIKVCCYGDKKLETCGECREYGGCVLLSAFHGKDAREYREYRRSLDFIRAHGYSVFAERARGWKRAYGEL